MFLNICVWRALTERIFKRIVAHSCFFCAAKKRLPCFDCLGIDSLLSCLSLCCKRLRQTLCGYMDERAGKRIERALHRLGLGALQQWLRQQQGRGAIFGSFTLHALLQPSQWRFRDIDVLMPYVGPADTDGRTEALMALLRLHNLQPRISRSARNRAAKRAYFLPSFCSIERIRTLRTRVASVQIVFVDCSRTGSLDAHIRWMVDLPICMAHYNGRKLTLPPEFRAAFMRGWGMANPSVPPYCCRRMFAVCWLVCCGMA